jgi:hypothetical protein
MHHESKISNIVNEGADHPIQQKNIKFVTVVALWKTLESKYPKKRKKSCQN